MEFHLIWYKKRKCMCVLCMYVYVCVSVNNGVRKHLAVPCVVGVFPTHEAVGPESEYIAINCTWMFGVFNIIIKIRLLVFHNDVSKSYGFAFEQIKLSNFQIWKLKLSFEQTWTFHTQRNQSWIWLIQIKAGL